MNRKRGWRKSLLFCKVSAFRFSGGKLIKVENGTNGGVERLGKDFVSIRSKGLLYLVPYRALSLVSGRKTKTRNRTTNATWRQEVVTWVDPYTNLWHFFYSRDGRLHRRPIVGVSKRGVLLSKPAKHGRLGRMYLLPYKRIGAAVEVLES